MDQLTTFYRNKAEDLQRQINLLEQKINEGYVKAAWTTAAENPVVKKNPVVKELTTEFLTAPNIKEAGKAIAHPIETATNIAGGVKNAVINPWDTAVTAAKFGTKVVKAVPTFGASAIIGSGAGDVTEKGAHALGITDPSAVDIAKSAADFGAFNATAAAIGTLGSGLGAAETLGVIGGGLASGALAGAAVIPIVAGGLIVGYKTADAALESDAGKAATKMATKELVKLTGAAPTGDIEQQRAAITAQAEEIKKAAALERKNAEANRQQAEQQAEVDKQTVMRGGEAVMRGGEVPTFVDSIVNVGKATQEAIGRASMGQNPFKGPAVPEGTEEEIKERRRKAAERR